MKGARSDDSLRCTFCHKRQDRVAKLISNPPSYQHRAYICDECIMVCYTILTDDRGDPGLSIEPQTTPPVEN